MYRRGKTKTDAPGLPSNGRDMGIVNTIALLPPPRNRHPIALWPYDGMASCIAKDAFETSQTRDTEFRLQNASYVAVSVNLLSRITVILMVLGYCSSVSMRLRSSFAISRARSSVTSLGETTTRISRPA